MPDSSEIRDDIKGVTRPDHDQTLLLYSEGEDQPVFKLTRRADNENDIDLDRLKPVQWRGQGIEKFSRKP